MHFAFRSLHLTHAIAPRRGVSDRFRAFADGSGGILLGRARRCSYPLTRVNVRVEKVVDVADV